MLTIYHNTRCSKSREALALTQQFASQHAIELDVIDYQKTPLTREQLVALHAALQRMQPISVREVMRTNEDIYAALKLDNADDEALLNALAAHPILLQRPIIQFGPQAIIARPPERTHLLLKV